MRFYSLKNRELPQSYNTYDSYGEALMIKGTKQIQYSIIKVFGVKSKNDNAKEKLKILEQ